MKNTTGEYITILDSNLNNINITHTNIDDLEILGANANKTRLEHVTLKTPFVLSIDLSESHLTDMQVKYGQFVNCDCKGTKEL